MLGRVGLGGAGEGSGAHCELLANLSTLWPSLQCSVTCGPGTKRRAVACTQDTGVPCDEAERPPSQAPCLLRPCLQNVDYLDPPEGSGSSGFFSRELDNEVDFVPRHPPPPPAPAEPPGQGNAIDQKGPELGPPGPALVDDFYYDYNFIRFHENLSQDEDEDEEPGPHHPVGTGDQPSSPPPQSGPAELPTHPPAPRSSQAGTHLPPLSEQTPWDPLLNFLPTEDAPTGTLALGLPSSSWPPASVGEMPAIPGRPDESLAPSWPPPPWWESTNEVPEDEEDALGPPGLPLPGMPESPILFSTHPSLNPDSEELWPPMGGAPFATSLPDLQTPVVPREHEPGVPTPLSPAEASPSDSSRVSEAPLLDPLDPPRTRNASWEVGDWSQASVGGS